MYRLRNISSISENPERRSEQRPKETESLHGLYVKTAIFTPSAQVALCTPGMSVNLWGVSPLCVNPVNG